MPPNEKNSLRIIGGKHRGRKLRLPDKHHIRPTPERVRETVFNWLQGKIENYKVLDLFAGSGAMGLEALSRGAKSVVFVDAEKLVKDQLNKNLDRLDEKKQTKVFHEDAEKWLNKNKEKFDLIFLDPPFDYPVLENVFSIIEDRNYAETGAWIYIEKNKNSKWPISKKEWYVYREGIAGQVSFRLMQKKDKISKIR